MINKIFDRLFQSDNLKIKLKKERFYEQVDWNYSGRLFRSYTSN